MMRPSTNLATDHPRPAESPDNTTVSMPDSDISEHDPDAAAAPLTDGAELEVRLRVTQYLISEPHKTFVRDGGGYALLPLSYKTAVLIWSCVDTIWNGNDSMCKAGDVQLLKEHGFKKFMAFGGAISHAVGVPVDFQGTDLLPKKSRINVRQRELQAKAKKLTPDELNTLEAELTLETNAFDSLTSSHTPAASRPALAERAISVTAEEHEAFCELKQQIKDLEGQVRSARVAAGQAEAQAEREQQRADAASERAGAACAEAQAASAAADTLREELAASQRREEKLKAEAQGTRDAMAQQRIERAAGASAWVEKTRKAQARHESAKTKEISKVKREAQTLLQRARKQHADAETALSTAVAERNEHRTRADDARARADGLARELQAAKADHDKVADKLSRLDFDFKLLLESCAEEDRARAEEVAKLKRLTRPEAAAEMNSLHTRIGELSADLSKAHAEIAKLGTQLGSARKLQQQTRGERNRARKNADAHAERRQLAEDEAKRAIDTLKERCTYGDDGRSDADEEDESNGGAVELPKSMFWNATGEARGYTIHVQLICWQLIQWRMASHNIAKIGPLFARLFNVKLPTHRVRTAKGIKEVPLWPSASQIQLMPEYPHT